MTRDCSFLESTRGASSERGRRLGAARRRTDAYGARFACASAGATRSDHSSVRRVSAHRSRRSSMFKSILLLTAPPPAPSPAPRPPRAPTCSQRQPVKRRGKPTPRRTALPPNLAVSPSTSPHLGRISPYHAVSPPPKSRPISPHLAPSRSISLPLAPSRPKSRPISLHLATAHESDTTAVATSETGISSRRMRLKPVHSQACEQRHSRHRTASPPR